MKISNIKTLHDHASHFQILGFFIMIKHEKMKKILYLMIISLFAILLGVSTEQKEAKADGIDCSSHCVRSNKKSCSYNDGSQVIVCGNWKKKLILQ